MIPKNLGEFELQEEIGRGPSATVYKAVSPNVPNPAALKVFNFDLQSSADLPSALQRATALAARLEHQNAIRIYGLASDPSSFCHYIAMECIDSVSLRALLDHYQKFDCEQACRLVQTVAVGIANAHRQNIYHGGLLPENVLIEKETGRVVITDFGVSALLAAYNPDIAAHPQRSGYHAPEWNGKQPDMAGDIFSLGALLYHLLTGQPPQPELVSVSGQEAPTIPKLRSLIPSLPHWLEALIANCLLDDPQERLTSADDIIEEIEFGLNSEDDILQPHSFSAKNDYATTSNPRISAPAGSDNVLRHKNAGSTLGMLMRQRSPEVPSSQAVQNAEKRLLELNFEHSGAIPHSQIKRSVPTISEVSQPPAQNLQLSNPDSNATELSLKHPKKTAEPLTPQTTQQTAEPQILSPAQTQQTKQQKPETKLQPQTRQAKSQKSEPKLQLQNQTQQAKSQTAEPKLQPQNQPQQSKSQAAKPKLQLQNQQAKSQTPGPQSQNQPSPKQAKGPIPGPQSQNQAQHKPTKHPATETKPQAFAKQSQAVSQFPTKTAAIKVQNNRSGPPNSSNAQSGQPQIPLKPQQPRALINPVPADNNLNLAGDSTVRVSALNSQSRLQKTASENLPKQKDGLALTQPAFPPSPVSEPPRPLPNTRPNTDNLPDSDITVKVFSDKQPAQPPKKAHKGSSGWMAAILLVLLLGGAGLFFYFAVPKGIDKINTQNHSDKPAADNSSVNAVPTAPHAPENYQGTLQIIAGGLDLYGTVIPFKVIADDKQIALSQLNNGIGQVSVPLNKRLTVRVTADNYEAEPVSITLTAQNPKSIVQLELKTALCVTIQAHPHAVILINGVKAGTCDSSGKYVLTKKHLRQGANFKIKADKAKYIPAETTISIQ
ncbi:MAG: protein kinase [bacterium]|nr:protein kinase [bacterium]